jgi:hypothetical protein
MRPEEKNEPRLKLPDGVVFVERPRSAAADAAWLRVLDWCDEFEEARRSRERQNDEEIQAMSIEPDRVYLPIEVAGILRCGRANVYNLMASGAIASVAVGAGNKGKRITGRAILAFLEDRTEGRPQANGTFKYLRPRLPR